MCMHVYVCVHVCVLGGVPSYPTSVSLALAGVLQFHSILAVPGDQIPPAKGSVHKPSVK